MKELNSDPQIEIKQLCPKVSILEFFRASLLFGLLFGMIALAAMPQGTIPVLFLFSPNEHEAPASSSSQNPVDPFCKDNTNPNEKRFPLPFGVENQRVIGQTVQATTATPPRQDGDSLRLPLNGSAPSDFLVTSFEEGSTGTIPPQQSQIYEENASQFATTDGYQSPLEGVSQTGFTTRGYQTSRRTVPGGIEDVSVSNEPPKPITQSQVPPMGGGVSDRHISAEVTNSRVQALASQLQQLGAVHFRLEKWGNDGQLYRFWCEMPLASATGSVAFFEAVAPQPEEAMANVVKQVEHWLEGTTRPYQ